MNSLKTKNTFEKSANQMAAEEEKFNANSISEEIEPLLKTVKIKTLGRSVQEFLF